MYRPIMYNEEKEAKEIYECGFTNKEYNFRESVLVAKHLRHVLGYGDARVKTALKEFCNTKANFFVEVPNLKNIKMAVSRSRRPFVDKSVSISISQSEIDVIKKFVVYKKRKILFAILVLAKINNGYLNNHEWNKIRRTLHSKITNKNIAMLMFEYASEKVLYASGSYHKVLFVDNQSPTVFLISSETINNLGKVFENIFGKDLFVCAGCGESHERRSYNQKRCHECSEIHKKERWRLQKIRQRKKMSAN